MIAIDQRELNNKNDSQSEQSTINDSEQILSTSNICDSIQIKTSIRNASNRTKNLLNDSTSDDEIYEDFESAIYSEGVYSTQLQKLSSHLPVEANITYQGSNYDDETEYDSTDKESSNSSQSIFKKVKKKKILLNREEKNSDDESTCDGNVNSYQKNLNGLSDFFRLSDTDDSRPFAEGNSLKKAAEKELANMMLSSDLSMNEVSETSFFFKEFHVFSIQD